MFSGYSSEAGTWSAGFEEKGKSNLLWLFLLLIPPAPVGDERKIDFVGCPGGEKLSEAGALGMGV